MNKLIINTECKEVLWKVVITVLLPSIQMDNIILINKNIIVMKTDKLFELSALMQANNRPTKRHELLY